MEGMAFLNARKVLGRHEPVGVGLFRMLGGYSARRIVSSFVSTAPRRLLALRKVGVEGPNSGRWGASDNRGRKSKLMLGSISAHDSIWLCGRAPKRVIHLARRPR